MALPASADDAVSAARDHFRKGSRAFDLGHYPEAIKEYEEAYNLKEDPALLFNIAQAHRLNGDHQSALRAYRSFLNRMPRAPNRAEVERRILDLQSAIEQQQRQREEPPRGTLGPTEPTAPAPPPALPVQTPPPAVAPPIVTTPPPVTVTPVAAAPPSVDLRPGRTKKIVGITLVSVGVGAVVVGAVFGSLAAQAGDDLTRLNKTMGTFDAAKQSTGKSDQLASEVCFGVGAAAAIVGGVLVGLGFREAKHAQSPVAIVPMGTAGAAVMVKF